MIKTESVPQLPILLLNRKALLFFPWPDETLLWSSTLDLSSFHPLNSPKLLQWLYKQGNWGCQGPNPHDCDRDLSLGPGCQLLCCSVYSLRWAGNSEDGWRDLGTRVIRCQACHHRCAFQGEGKGKEWDLPLQEIAPCEPHSGTHTAKVESWRTFCTATKAEE